MIAESKITEYRNFCDILLDLQEKYLKRRQELRRILAETITLRKKALIVLAKANRITRHMTGRQRQMAGFSCSLNEIKARINRIDIEQNSLVPLNKGDSADESEALDKIRLQRDRKDYRSLMELKQRALTILSMIDAAKKKLLQLDLLELRCRELILATNKALEAFRHEYILIRRKIYPLGIFSLLHRKLRSLLGRAYFTLRDMEDMRALGNITGHVLRIADSPII